MIYRASNGQMVEHRMPHEEHTLLWPDALGGPSYAGPFVTQGDVVGLPAVACAVQLVAQTIGSLPLNVYLGRQGDKREAADSWQWQLLHKRPCGDECTAVDFLSDVAACLELAGNCFVLKVKAPARRGGRVVALRVLDPARVRVERKDGAKTFVLWEEGKQKRFTPADVVHFRGFTVNGAASGISPIGLHRHKLGQQLAASEWEGRFYSNGMRAGGAIQVPEDLTPEQQREYQARFEQNHGGVRNAHRPLFLVNGATWVDTTMSPQDAQFVETQKLGIVEVAQIFRLPLSFLAYPADRETRSSPEHELMRLLFALQPRLRRIEATLAGDHDLFAEADPYPLFDTSALVRTDAKTRAEVRHLEIQDGSLLVDEARAELGRPPLPPLPDDPTKEPGKVPQITPVGGAPNPNLEEQ